MAYNDIFPIGAIIDNQVLYKTKHLQERIDQLEKDNKVVVFLQENFPSLLEQIKKMSEEKP